MAIWKYTPNLGLWSGLAIGAGLILAPIALPAVAGMARPVVKGALKGIFTVYEGGRQLIGDTVQGAEDLIEEARSEVNAELAEKQES